MIHSNMQQFPIFPPTSLRSTKQNLALYPGGPLTTANNPRTPHGWPTDNPRTPKDTPHVLHRHSTDNPRIIHGKRIGYPRTPRERSNTTPRPPHELPAAHPRARTSHRLPLAHEPPMASMERPQRACGVPMDRPWSVQEVSWVTRGV